MSAVPPGLEKKSVFVLQTQDFRPGLKSPAPLRGCDVPKGALQQRATTQRVLRD
jgi:hypothetical protein